MVPELGRTSSAMGKGTSFVHGRSNAICGTSRRTRWPVISALHASNSGGTGKRWERIVQVPAGSQPTCLPGSRCPGRRGRPPAVSALPVPASSSPGGSSVSAFADCARAPLAAHPLHAGGSAQPSSVRRVLPAQRCPRRGGCHGAGLRRTRWGWGRRTRGLALRPIAGDRTEVSVLRFLNPATRSNPSRLVGEIPAALPASPEGSGDTSRTQDPSLQDHQPCCSLRTSSAQRALPGPLLSPPRTRGGKCRGIRASAAARRSGPGGPPRGGRPGEGAAQARAPSHRLLRFGGHSRKASRTFQRQTRGGGGGSGRSARLPASPHPPPQQAAPVCVQGDCFPLSSLSI